MTGIDVAALLQHPDLASAMNQPENRQKRQDFENSVGVKLNDLKQVFILVDASGRSSLLVKVDPGMNVEQILKRSEVSFKKIRSGKYSVIQLQNPVKGNRMIEFTELAPGVIFAGEMGSTASLLNTGIGGAQELAAVVKAVPAAPVWFAFVNLFKDAGGKVSDPRSLYLTFDFGGENKRDCFLEVVMTCGKPKGAKIMQGMVPLYLNMGLAMLVTDPQLCKELTEGVSFAIKGSTLTVKVAVTEQTGRKLADYLQANSGRLLRRHAGMADDSVEVPAPAGDK